MIPLWDYPARKAAVLYLALEDDYRRLQERLYRMFGTDGADNLFFSVSAGNLGNGLDGQLQEFMKKHNDTRLIIIDTLQKMREVGGDNYSYANDYEIITKLKQFADSYGICILLVHHTRKQGSPEYQLPEPQGLMSAKTYKNKLAEPLVQKLKSLVKTALIRCFEAYDSYYRLNITNSNLHRENERLTKTNEKLAGENENLRAENKNYKLLKKAFGSKQMDSLLEQAKAVQQSKQRGKHFRNNQEER